MSRTLLIGPAGSGKTHRLLDQFEQSLRTSEDPLAEDCFFILPSAEHTERVMSLILQRGLKGFFHKRVTTLSRLITQVFGLGEERVASSVTRFVILGDILSQNTWDYFSEVQTKPGFLHLISSFLTELKESLVWAPEFREKMNELKKLEPILASKYEALAAIYELYEVRLKEEGLIDRQDTLKLLRAMKEKRHLRSARFKKIWLDGFFDFSELQLAYLSELAEMTDEMTVSLTKDLSRSRENLFEVVTRTEEALLKMGFKREPMKTASQRTQVPALQYLERNLFRGTRPQKGNRQEVLPVPFLATVKPAGEIPIHIFEAIGVQGEIEMIARRVDSLQRSEGYRFSDFAILLREIGSYEAVIRSIFARYGIPVEIHERERLEHSPIIQTVVTLLKIFQDGWKRMDLIRFLKSCYVASLGKVSKDYEWASELERRATREGIGQGREEWLRPWSGQPGDKGLREFNEEKAKGLEPLWALEDNFRKTKAFSEMRQLLLEAYRKTFKIFQVQDSVDESVRRDAASARRLEALLEEIRIHFTMGGRSEITLEEFTDQFFRLVELDLYSLHERDKNRVQVYDVSLARQKEYRVVFVAGLLEKGFPVQIKEDPLLSDWERRLLNGTGPVRLKERLPRQNLERYLFYLAVTRAGERLFLTCPRLNLEGKESLPSFYLDEVRSLFGSGLEEKKQALAHPFPELREAVTERELHTAIMGELWSRDLEEKEIPLLLSLTARLFEKGDAKEKFKKCLYEIRPELKDPIFREKDIFRSRETSATRLEDYAKCPYKYFAGRILQLKDPNEEINIKLKGTILHEVLEHYFRQKAAGPPDLFEKEKALSFILRELEKALEKHPLIAEKRYQLELDRAELEEMLERFLGFEIERLKSAALQPRYFEFSFGTRKDDDSPPLEITEGSRKVMINGKIDRIDVDREGRYGLVIDYKRSAQFNRHDLDFGTSLQLPIYLTVVEKFLKLKPVGGELYSLKERKKKGFYHCENAAAFMDLPARAQRISQEEYSKTMERSLQFIRRFTGAMENVEIPVRPRACEPHCPFPSLCRIEKWKLPAILEEIKEEDRKVMS